MTDLRNKVAVITGAGSGIGCALAKALAREGARVAMLDLQCEQLDAAVEQVRAGGGEAIGIVADVFDAAAIEAAAAATINAFGKVHILVNNAGVCLRGPKLFEVGDDIWNWMLGVNLFGTLHCLRTFVPLISSHGEGGHILTTGSVSGFVSTNRRTGVYTTTKYALTGLTDSLSDELEGTGIGVSLLLPGWVKTEIYANSASLRGTLCAATAFDAPTTEFAKFMSADEVAARAIAGIKANQPYIATDPQARAMHQQRHRVLMAAYDAAEAWHPEAGE